MVYTCNQDIKRLVKRAAAAQDLTLSALAGIMGKLPQELNNTLAKKHITFDDLQAIAQAMNYKLVFDIVPDGPGGSQDKQP